MFRFQLIAALLLVLLYCPISSNAQCVSTMVMSPNGENPIRVTVGDGIPDMIMFNHSDAGESAYAYAITDQNFNILNITPETENSADFEGAGEGACWVWGFSYTGDITANVGDFVFRTQFSTGCWQISRTALNIIRTMDNTPVVGQLFASSNNQGLVGVYSFLSDNSTRKRSFPSAGADADGIYYDADADVAYQLDRSNNAIQAFSGVNDSGFNPMITASSSMDFANGREIAVTADKIVAAQDANDSNGGNQFFVYDYSPTGITLDKIYDADINLWGIHVEGSTIFAIEDNSNRLAVYEDFFNQPAGAITATRSIEVEGIIRTHGITYDPATDVMYLTDVGAASSPTDGAFTVVPNFMMAMMDGMISLDEQMRVAGEMSLLGNPVDIAFDNVRNMIFIAERANNGGRILGFSIPTVSGDAAPNYIDDFAGASAVYFSNPAATAMSVAQIYASSNNSGMVGVFDIKSDNSVMMSNFPSMAMDADGIFYDADMDVLYQLNRSDNVVNTYANASSNPTLMASSSADSANGREIAVSGNKLVVAQDANDSNGGNQFFVYDYSPTAITLDKVYDADINLWGIHLEGSTMFAIEDNTNRLAVYENFFERPAGAISATRSIEIEGIVRTHGITYDAATDVMYLTDVGAASSPTDGTFTVIANFMTAMADGIVTLSEQIIVAGDATFLGNPVDIAYDSNSDMIFIAERANGGGRILGFTTPTTSGNIAPDYNAEFAGASAVYSTSASMRFVSNSPLPAAMSTIKNQALEVFPNPTNEVLNIKWEYQESVSNAVLRVFNLQGQEVLRQRINIQDQNQTSLNVTSLLAGIYQVTLEYNDTLQQQRFVKQ